MAGFYGRDFLTLADWSGEQIRRILKLAAELKGKLKQGQEHRLLEGKTLAMIFEKSSTRTRVSFEVGMWQLGGKALFLNPQDLQMGRGEPIKDTARVLSRYVDAIMIRARKHETVEELAREATVPVINGLTDRYHPCQVLADLLTIQERCRNLREVKLAYVGDGNNVANSLLIGGAKMGMKVAVATPPEYAPRREVVRLAKKAAKESGGQVILTSDPREAVSGAHVLYTDVWVSMGHEDEAPLRRRIMKPYQLNKALVNRAEVGAMVLHCLPAHRGEEITDQVFEEHAGEIMDQAENRLHVKKA
ncbi:MAG TPA: ornithine carbamoyltransferase, partial [Bacillota bacterium]|nr:ornithine carbamoyltransferase [Bacillota bacterium]